MSGISAEALTAQFYEWERRGRGWHACDEPVDIEPSFFPFSRYAMATLPVVDDSRRDSLFTSIAGLFKAKEPTYGQFAVPASFPPIEGIVFNPQCDLRVYAIRLPKDAQVSAIDIEPLLLMLSCKT